MPVIEQRYAQALADVVARGDIPAATLRQELRGLAELIEASAPLRLVLASPAVAWEQKLGLLQALAGHSQVSRITRNFLVVAAQRGRLALLPGMEQAFERLLLEQQGVVRAEVASARALSAGERAALEAGLARRLGRQLDTRYRTDPELVGGFVARVGDQVFDGSLRGRLQRLRQHLLAGN